jgi:hypothetical protein
MRSMRQSRLLWLAICAGTGPFSPEARAIVTFGGTGYNSGPVVINNQTIDIGSYPIEDYEGTFDTGYTATPITSNMILGASHIFPGYDTSFVYNNGTATATTYTVQVVATLDDLAVWEIAPNQTGAFSLTAPIYTGSSEVGSTIVDLGRGYQRGGTITGGWGWGGSQGPLSWGTNTVSAIDANWQLGTSGSLGGDFLQYDFNNEPDPTAPGYNPNECMITPFDSGGGVFIDVNGQYQLAAVNTAYDGVFDSSGNSVGGTLYDTYGYYEEPGQKGQITSQTPESSFATRISSKQNFVGLADGTIPASQAAAYPIDDDGLLTLYSNLTTGAITGGAQVVFGGGNAPKLTIASNSGVSEISSLSIPSGSVLDITNNELVIDYGSGPDPIASIEQWIKNGYYGLAGPKIISSAVAMADATSGLSYGIGYADSADPNNPANLPAGTIEIMFTLMGDANLDGTVNSEDFTLFSERFGQSGVTWDEGDFNYDGTVNAEDFASFAHNLGQTAALGSPADFSEGVANGISLANVPEPASAGIMMLAALTVLRRRRSERPSLQAQ